ncbi:MAG TPA: hypothetical protein VMM76_07490 [Pirellulaceae bacterium]|nr:hypothetical protein [Pirellulaceae bacterium]
MTTATNWRDWDTRRDFGLTQLVSLFCLAPDLEEPILLLPATDRGRDAVMERNLRAIATVADWRKHRQMWRRMISPRTSPTRALCRVVLEVIPAA